MAQADTITPLASLADETALGPTDLYTYTPLHDNAREIRLLWVRSASSPYDLIQCSLHVIQLGDNQDYMVTESKETSLPSTHMLLCEGYLFPVIEDIYSRLHRLRGLGWQWIWLKEVCVNLQDPDESSQQLELAPVIYEHAIRQFMSSSLQELEPPEPLEYPILAGVDEIRLLELDLTTLKHPPLQFKFRVVSLTDSPPFIALYSNLPADEMFSEDDIFCGYHMQASELIRTIYHDSESLRSTAHAIIWVYELCVNRDDPKEKSYHAALQQKIFEKATLKLSIQYPELQYQSLDSTNSEIRLLRIHPTKSVKSPLVVEIFTASLNDKPEYVALSYVWGSNTSNCGILSADRCTIRVTENLFLALHELRQHQYQVVWADQICINQLDPQERGQQVAMMSRIYRQARSVVVHLRAICQNPEPHFCHSDWPVLMRILSLTRRVLRAVRPDRPRLNIAEFQKFGLPQSNHKSWAMWSALRSHPWFSRGWIVQEIAVSIDAWVIYSQRLFKWIDLVDANDAVKNETIHYRSNEGLCSNYGRILMHNFAHLRVPGASYSLLELLRTFRNIQITHGRDKIYAFRGIASDMENTPVPNYTQPDTHVYHEFAKYFISRGQGMDLICEAGLNKTSLEVPSWVADWGFHPVSTSNSGQQRLGDLLCSQKKPNQDQKHIADVTLTNDPLVISVKGCMIDTLISVTNAFDPDEKTFSFDAAARELLTSTYERPERYTKTLQDDYARTLIGGDASFGDPKALYEEANLQKRQSRETENRRLSGLRFGYVGGESELERYINIRDMSLCKRRFGVTKKGYMGLFPLPAAKGDNICFFKGGKAPFILRKSGSAYILVGDSYVHGLTQEDIVSTKGLDYETILLR